VRYLLERRHPHLATARLAPEERAHRKRRPSQGLRPIQIRVPDVRSKDFRDEAQRQSVAVAESAHAKADQDFIDAVSELDGA
jgi:hypothetical protein